MRKIKRPIRRAGLVDGRELCELIRILSRNSRCVPLSGRYSRELAALPDTYRLALDWDVSPLARVVERLARGPLRVVGSGGSFSGAVFCAGLHELHLGQLAKAVTPLEVVRRAHGLYTGLLCMSASGRNNDIRSAFTAAATAEVQPLAALCLDTGVAALSTETYSP